jgi:hypothetical protein
MFTSDLFLEFEKLPFLRKKITYLCKILSVRENLEQIPGDLTWNSSVERSYQEQIQLAPLNGITLGQTILDPNKRMIPLTEFHFPMNKLVL